MITLSFSNAVVEGLQAELIRALRLNNLRLYKIGQGLLWVHEGKGLKQIAQLLQVDVKTIYNWLRRFIVKGFGWVCTERYQGRGRKSKLSAEQKQVLYERVKAGPEASGFSSGLWNSAMIAELIWRRWGIRYNPRYLSGLLKKLGLSYQKACVISDKCDEDAYEQARREWVEQTWPGLVKRARATGAVILFTDEVSFALWGSLGRTWAPRGCQPRVKTTGQRKGLKILGAIDFHSGAFYYREARAYKLTAKALTERKAQGLSAEKCGQLKGLKGIVYSTRAQYLSALEQVLQTPLSEHDQTALVQVAVQENGQFNSDSYIEFLNQLLVQIKQPIILIEDSVAYHCSKAVRQFCATLDQGRLEKVALPTFSPDMNPIEKLWKNTKRDATHLKYFVSFDQLRASVLEVFCQYLEEATKVIRVMKKLRTQAGLA
jgi:transposase